MVRGNESQNPRWPANFQNVLCIESLNVQSIGVGLGLVLRSACTHLVICVCDPGRNFCDRRINACRVASIYDLTPIPCHSKLGYMFLDISGNQY